MTDALKGKGTKPGVGQVVEATVEQVQPYGVFVRLGDNTPAYIRRRQLSLEGDIDPRTLVKPGQVLMARVIYLGSDTRLMELSVKHMSPDRWTEAVRHIRPGIVVDGTVKKLTADGIYLQMVPGVEGFVPISEMPMGKEALDQLFWKGDLTEAVVLSVDISSRRMTLSIRERIRQLVRVDGVLEALRPAVPRAPKPEPLFAEGAGSLDLAQAGPVLVVDDCALVRKALEDALAGYGCEAHSAATGSEALALLNQHHYKLILVDLQLGQEDGLDLIAEISAQGIDAVLAVMSTPECLQERMDRIHALKISEALSKFQVTSELEQLLRRVASGRPLGAVPKLQARQTEQDSTSEWALPVRSTESATIDLQQVVDQVRRAARADYAVLFHLDPVAQTISVMVQSGSQPLDASQAYSLIASPVKDVIQEGQSIWEGRIDPDHEPRFRKLLDWVEFESCIGLPIEANGQVEHALFVFSTRRGWFPGQIMRRVRTLAVRFSLALESQNMDSRLRLAGRILLSGQLAAGYGHEVYNKTSALQLQCEALLGDMQRLERSPARLEALAGFQEMRDSVTMVAETVRDLTHFVTEFRGLMDTREETFVDVNLVIRQTETLIWPVANKARVDIRLHLSPDLPPVRGGSTSLKNVFLNLMLNAVQQMERKADGHRTLEVTTTYVATAPERPVQLRFSDRGPGIHRQLWERIFAAGFTTRPGGTGLGLYIARNLLDLFGATVRVEQSLVPLGTTFLIELAAQPTE